MGVIDTHTHTGCGLEDYPPAWPDSGAEVYSGFGKFPEIGEMIVEVTDPTGEKTLKKMDEAGIEKSVLLPLDFNLVGRDIYRAGRNKGLLPIRPIEETLKRFADLQSKYPDRFIAFAGLDLRRGVEGLELLGKAVIEWGLKGLKLHSTSGFYVNDPQYYPFYELCVDLDIPVVIHSGFEFPPNRAKFADPIFIDDVACDFPELRIIIAHMGGHAHGPAWHYRDTAINLITVHRNVYTDIADLQSIYIRNPIDFYQSLRRALDFAPDKVLYGSDGPWLDVALPAKDYINVIRNPDKSILEKAGVEFKKEEIDGILSENAKRALKLE